MRKDQSLIAGSCVSFHQYSGIWIFLRKSGIVSRSRQYKTCRRTSDIYSRTSDCEKIRTTRYRPSVDLHGLRLTKQGKKCWLQITSYCCSRSLFFTTLIAKPDSLKGLENITLQAVRSAGICIECTECDHSYDATEP